MIRRALVVGLGSIGQRHLRLLRKLKLDVAAVSTRPNADPAVYTDLEEAVAIHVPDYVVVANATADHRTALDALARTGFAGQVLVEKPLFATPTPLPAARFEVHVGYNLRFHPVLAELRRRLTGERVLTVLAYTGSFLPDWRPGRDYRATASARRAAGGGVLRDLSHELDYITWLVGPSSRVAAIARRVGDLEVDCEDAATVMMATEHCPMVTCQLSYLDRQPARFLRVVTASRCLSADLMNGILIDGDECVRWDVARDDTYIAQHRAVIEGERDVLCSGSDALRIVDLIMAIETAAAQERWVEA